MRNSPVKVLASIAVTCRLSSLLEITKTFAPEWFMVQWLVDTRCRAVWSQSGGLCSPDLLQLCEKTILDLPQVFNLIVPHPYTYQPLMLMIYIKTFLSGNSPRMHKSLRRVSNPQYDCTNTLGKVTWLACDLMMQSAILQHSQRITRNRGHPVAISVY